jgi:hypothetical protein
LNQLFFRPHLPLHRLSVTLYTCLHLTLFHSTME